MASRAGSPNKNKVFLLNRLKEIYGDDYHPILKMAENAYNYQNQVVGVLDCSDEKYGSSLIEANKLWDGIAQYVEPKLKAIDIDHGIQEDNPITKLLAQISGNTLEPK